MRSQKLFVVSATMFATLSIAGFSFADPPAPMTPATSGTSPSAMAPSASTPTSSTMPTTTAPTSTTPAPIAPAAPMTDATSTTTTTGADTEPPPSPTYTSPPRESTVLTTGKRPNRPILFTGGALFIGTYATTAAITAGSNTKEDHDLYLPVVGPWINLANRSCEGDCTATHNRNTVLIAGSGVLQGVGVGMVLASFLIPEKVATATIAAGPVKMQVVPTAGGMGAVGTF